MKKCIIMISVLGLFLEISAKEYMQDTPSRTQMLLEAKQLLQRYDMLKNKKAAWQKRQIVIIDDFDKTHETDEHFGEKNRYGKKRLEKRQFDFYTSLQEKNDEIEQTLLAVQRKLSKVKKKFSHLYAVPMTVAEIRGGSAPTVSDKKNKIRLLKEYLGSKDSWSACLQKNKSFDAKRVNLENSANLTLKSYEHRSDKLDKEVEKNFTQISKYKQISQNAQQEYRQKYGYYIQNAKTAKSILKNIKD